MKTTRKEKRLLNQEKNMFKELLKIIQHYFPKLLRVLATMDDPRHQSYITYSTVDILMTRILGACCHCESMRHMNSMFNTDGVIKNIEDMLSKEFEEVPHGDTINDYLKEVSIEGMRNIMRYMVKELLDKKVLNEYRIEDTYHQIVLDGSQMYSYNKEHIEGSLKREHKDTSVTYHSDVVLAVIPIGKVIVPVDFEMIENEGVQYDKQDCELKAAKRLLKRIKETYPRLKICISGDGLYFNEWILKFCKESDWRYIIRYKTGCASSVEEYYQVTKTYGDTRKYKEIRNKEEIEYEYDNGIEYHGYKVNMCKMEIQKEKKVITFSFVTDIKITDKNIVKVGYYGRQRWKIENKGFNDQKNHGYGMKHAFSYDENAIKGHYLLMLVSQLLMQLLEHYEKVKGRFESIRKLGEEIKEALRNAVLSTQDQLEIISLFQIRKEISY